MFAHFCRLALAVVALFFVAGCAQVPKESVELSATVGRDLTASHKAHRELAKVLFSRMKDDVSRFVDNVYAPYQIRTALQKDADASQSSDQAVRNGSLLLGISAAYAPGATNESRKNAIAGMSYLIQDVKTDIDSKRAELLKPIEDQEATLLGALDRNYTQIIYANSIVTGYLGSVVKVHDAQSELLRTIGIDGNLPEMIGTKLAGASAAVTNLVAKAEKADATAKSIAEGVASLKASIQLK
jgi:hypothetical protein